MSSERNITIRTIIEVDGEVATEGTATIAPFALRVSLVPEDLVFRAVSELAGKIVHRFLLDHMAGKDG